MNEFFKVNRATFVLVNDVKNKIRELCRIAMWEELVEDEHKLGSLHVSSRAIALGFYVIFYFKNVLTLNPKCHLQISSRVKAVFSEILRISFLSFFSHRRSRKVDGWTPIIFLNYILFY